MPVAPKLVQPHSIRQHRYKAPTDTSCDLLIGVIKCGCCNWFSDFLQAIITGSNKAVQFVQMRLNKLLEIQDVITTICAKLIMRVSIHPHKIDRCLNTRT